MQYLDARVNLRSPCSARAIPTHASGSTNLSPSSSARSVIIWKMVRASSYRACSTRARPTQFRKLVLIPTLRAWSVKVTSGKTSTSRSLAPPVRSASAMRAFAYRSTPSNPAPAMGSKVASAVSASKSCITFVTMKCPQEASSRSSSVPAVLLALPKYRFASTYLLRKYALRPAAIQARAVSEWASPKPRAAPTASGSAAGGFPREKFELGNRELDGWCLDPLLLCEVAPSDERAEAAFGDQFPQRRGDQGVDPCGGRVLLDELEEVVPRVLGFQVLA